MSRTSNGRAAPGDDAIDQLSRIALSDHSMSTLLQRVVDLSNEVMPGNTETSITLLVRDRPTTPVSSGALAIQLDKAQFANGDGPCLHAARTGEVTEISDTRRESRWPGYTRRAVEYGNLSSLSLPLPIDGTTSAALNTYAPTAHAFDAGSRTLALRFAPYATVAIANMHAYQHAREMADNLQTALETRAVIDQAKGILMERFKLTPDQAFHMLAQASMRSNVKLRDVAERVVRTGEFTLP
jgi:GAF domain-containing protein